MEQKEKVFSVMQAYALSHNITISSTINECHAMLKYAHPGFPMSFFKCFTLQGTQNKQTITIVYKDAANMTHCPCDHVLEKCTRSERIIIPPAKRFYCGQMICDFI